MQHGRAGSRRGREPASTPHSALASILQQALQQALQQRLRDAIGAHRYGRGGKLAEWRDGLSAGVAHDLPSLRREVLRTSLARPDCGMALALNSFLPWQGRPEALRLCGTEGFAELHFDGRCPTGVRGTPPHIDVIASGPSGVVGATVRVFDYLGWRPSGLSPAYRGLQLPPSMAAWGDLLRLGNEPSSRLYRHVNALALAKLALGLGRIFARRPVRLLYLFLEPADAARSAPFAAHRAEPT